MPKKIYIPKWLRVIGLVIAVIVLMLFLLFTAGYFFFYFEEKNRIDMQAIMAEPGYQEVARKKSLRLEENIPAAQKSLVNIVEEYALLYQESENELKKSKIWKERGKKLFNQPDLQDGIFKNWIGVIDEMGTNSDGDAYLTIKINDKISIKTWNNSFSDIVDGTLIKHGTKIYTALEDLKKGATVVFSAKMIKFGNLTEKGKVTEPEIIAKFTKIEPI